MRHLLVALGVLCVTTAAIAEDWPQFRRDERHSGWATTALHAPLRRIHDGTLLTYRTGGWVPATAVQVDTVTVRGPIVMLMGSAAGGDPPQAHGAAKWAAYLDRTKQFASSSSSAYRPGLVFLESVNPKAGIETDSGWHPCQHVRNATLPPKGGFLMESGWLRWYAGTVSQRSQSDVFGPTTCRDDDSMGVTVSLQQWHGGGLFGRTFDMQAGSYRDTLWAQWGAVPNAPTDNEVLGYTIAADAVFAGRWLITNAVTSAGNPQNLPKGWQWSPQVSGLCVWDLEKSPARIVACREGSWGSLSTDGSVLWTYAQTPYPRIPDGYWAVGGASERLVALRLPMLETIGEWDAGQVPLTVQDAPLVGPEVVAAITYPWDEVTHTWVPILTGIDRATLDTRWQRPIPELAPRAGGCPYWAPRLPQQVALAGSGQSIVLASNGLTLIDAATGAVRWQGQQGTTYFNPTVADGQLYVLRDDSGPAPDPVTRNCSGSALEVWEGPAADEWPDTPTPTATAIPPTATATATAIPPTPTAAAPTCVPGCIP